MPSLVRPRPSRKDVAKQAKASPFTADGTKAPFWKQVLNNLSGEWWRPAGPIADQQVPDQGGATQKPLAQSDKRGVMGGVAVGDRSMDYSSFMPMRRLLGGLQQVWIDTVDVLPVTAYPNLLPRVPRSALSPLGAIRTSYQTDTLPDPNGQVRVYPRALGANTRVDMRWRAGSIGFAGGVPSYIAGQVSARTPAGATQAGFPFQRSAKRIPRYSTIPVITDPTSGPVTIKI